jgi:hypothetical protein
VGRGRREIHPAEGVVLVSGRGVRRGVEPAALAVAVDGLLFERLGSLDLCEAAAAGEVLRPPARDIIGRRRYSFRRSSGS